MIKFTLVVTLLFVFSGCMKRDVRFSPGTATKCNVAHFSSSAYDGLSFGNGMAKTFNEKGWVKTMKMAVAGNFDDVDSLFYNITYSTPPNGAYIIASISCIKKPYEGALSNNGVLIPHSGRSTETYILTATFDLIKGHLLKISGTGGFFPGVFILTYSASGRLLKFGTMGLVYDTRGNISRVPAKDGTGHSGMIYQYDLTKQQNPSFM